MKLRILHTNDLHSRLENFAKAAARINELRTENTLVLDAGDFNDFSRIEILGTKGRAGCSLLGLGGYDALAVGNNEGFAGIEALETMAAAGLVPLLSCNLYSDSLDEVRGLKRSIILERAGLRILIIGTTPRFNHFFSLVQLYASDPLEEVQRELEQNTGKFDICILLSHQGINDDVLQAEKLQGVHIIIGGHSHTLMEDASLVNGVIIHQSGCFGEYLGVLDIEIEGSEIKNCDAQNIRLDDTMPDEVVIKEISKQREIAVESLSLPLYTVERDIWHDIVEENPMTNLLADALRDTFSCDIGIINSGVISGGVRKGNISRKKLLEVGPSPLNPTYMEVKGSDIKEALRQSLQADVCLNDGKGPGFRGRYVGRLHISGGIVEHNGRDIIKVMLPEGEMKDDRVYSVAATDYLQRGSGYPSLGNNENVRYNAGYIRDTLLEYLNRRDFVDKCFIDRWIKSE